MRIFVIAVLLPVIVLSSACVRNRHYRVNNPILTDPVPSLPLECARITETPPIAFVEFDDMGELWDRCKGSRSTTCEYQRTMNLIEEHTRADRNIVVVTFIHGWKNNAAPGNGNVTNFQCMLKRLQQKDPASAYLGVYLAWRGKAALDPISSNLSFWNRRHAAMRVAAVSMTEVILGLMYKTKEGGHKPENAPVFVVIGHSFGGLILERAMAQALTGLLSNKALARPCPGDPSSMCFRSPADLIVLVNPALESIETQQLIDMFERKRIKVEGEGSLIVSITGKNDLATGVFLPAGHFLESLGKRFRPRESDSSACKIKAPSQRELYTHTAGHLRYFFSHELRDRECNGLSFLSFDGPKGRYYVCPIEPRCNHTPYWVLSVDKDIINGHNGIWGNELQKLLVDLINRRVALRQTMLRIQ